MGGSRHPTPLVEAEVLELAERVRTGIGDADVDASQLCDGLIDSRTDRCLVGDIARDRQGASAVGFDALHRGGGLGRVPGPHGNGGPGHGHPLREPEADAPVPTGDDRDLPAEVVAHGAGGFWPVMVQYT